MEIPPGRILFEKEKERSTEIFLYLEIFSQGGLEGTAGLILRLGRSKAQKKKVLEIVLEMLMLMTEVMEVVILCSYAEVEELVEAVEVELSSSVLESWQ